jgi:hypothetical protein
VARLPFDVNRLYISSCANASVSMFIAKLTTNQGLSSTYLFDQYFAKSLTSKFSSFVVNSMSCGTQHDGVRYGASHCRTLTVGGFGISATIGECVDSRTEHPFFADLGGR